MSACVSIPCLKGSCISPQGKAMPYDTSIKQNIQQRLHHLEGYSAKVLLLAGSLIDIVCL